MKNEGQKMIETENEPVRQLLGSLNRVEAPGDFDFRVKARIAQGRPVDRNTSLIPAWARFAMPVVLLLLLGGYFGFSTLYSPQSDVQPIAGSQLPIAPVSEVATKPVEPIEQAPASTTIAKQTAPKVEELNNIPKTVTAEKLVAKTASSNKNRGGGSVDFSSGISRTRDFRKPNSVGVSAREILSQMGVDASYSSSSWKVGVVKQNSVAERSGLKTGDVVEAINDQDLTDKSSFASPFKGTSVRVRRDGKTTQIELKP